MKWYEQDDAYIKAGEAAFLRAQLTIMETQRDALAMEVQRLQRANEVLSAQVLGKPLKPSFYQVRVRTRKRGK